MDDKNETAKSPAPAQPDPYRLTADQVLRIEALNVAYKSDAEDLLATARASYEFLAGKG